MRHLFTKYIDNKTMAVNFSEVVLPVFGQLCGEMTGQSNGHGLPCSTELTGFCLEMKRNVQGFLNISMNSNFMTENGTSAYSLVIRRLLDIWGTIEDTVAKVKQNLNWRNVLSAQLLAAFIELNHQLMDFGDIANHTEFQLRWSSVLTYLGYAMIMTERLTDCWYLNIDLKLNSSQHTKHFCIFDTSLWQLSEARTEILPGSHIGVQALRNTEQCFFDHAVPALQLVSRSVSSGLCIRICLLVLACLIYPIVMFSFKQMTEWIQNFALNLKERTEDLKHQRQLAEDLLHQMLPKSVAKQLRQHKHVEAESYEKVSAITK